MNIIRPITKADYSSGKEIAVESKMCFVFCQRRGLLRRKIDRAETAFNKPNVTEPGDESYLFVMEDTTTGQVVGATVFEAAVGIDDAFCRTTPKQSECTPRAFLNQHSNDEQS